LIKNVLFFSKDSSLSKLASGSSLKKEKFLTLAALAASTPASSSTVKPDDKIAQDRFMQYQKQAKLKAEQVRKHFYLNESNFLFRKNYTKNKKLKNVKMKQNKHVYYLESKSISMKNRLKKYFFFSQRNKW
jgi:hypothetical protein